MQLHLLNISSHFITGGSTDDALFSVNKFIHTNLDSSNYRFVKVKKAFDCIDHKIPLKKFNNSVLEGKICTTY